MVSPMTSSHLTLSDLERSNSKGHSDVEALYLVKEQSYAIFRAQLGKFFLHSILPVNARYLD